MKPTKKRYLPRWMREPREMTPGRFMLFVSVWAIVMIPVYKYISWPIFVWQVQQAQR